LQVKKMPEHLIREILEKHAVEERKLSNFTKIEPYKWFRVKTSMKKGEEAPVMPVLEADLEKGIERRFAGTLFLHGKVQEGAVPKILEVFEKKKLDLHEHCFGYTVFANSYKPENATEFIIHLFGVAPVEKLGAKGGVTPSPEDQRYYIGRLRKAWQIWITPKKARPPH